jgi:hypothetical protein
MKIACPRISRPPIFRICPFRIIAIASKPNTGAQQKMIIVRRTGDSGLKSGRFQEIEWVAKFYRLIG